MNICRYSYPITISVEEALDVLRKGAFREMAPGDAAALGYCRYDDIIDTTFTIMDVNPEGDRFIRFGLRIDRRKPSAKAIAKDIAERIKKDRKSWEEAHQNQPTLFDSKSASAEPKTYVLSKFRLREFKEQAKFRMTSLAVPEPEMAQVIWNTQRGIVYLLNSKAIFKKALNLLLGQFQRSTVETLPADIVMPVELDTQATMQAMGYEIIGPNPIGMQFLTWLWHIVERRADETIEIGGEQWAVDFIGAVKTDGRDEAGVKEALTAAGSRLESFREIETALGRGHLITQATLRFQADGSVHDVGIKAGDSTLSMKLPKRIGREDDEYPFGHFFHQALVMERVFGFVDELFQRFLAAELVAGRVVLEGETRLDLHFEAMGQAFKNLSIMDGGVTKVTMRAGVKEAVIYDSTTTPAESEA